MVEWMSSCNHIEIVVVAVVVESSAFGVAAFASLASLASVALSSLTFVA